MSVVNNVWAELGITTPIGFTPPLCANRCAHAVLSMYAAHDIDVVVSYMPMGLYSRGDAIRQICPHNVMWWAEPTAEQLERWIENEEEASADG